MGSSGSDGFESLHANELDEDNTESTRNRVQSEGGESIGESLWKDELRLALQDNADFSRIRSIAKNRGLPEDTRAMAWQILLGSFSKPDVFVDWDGLYDLTDQSFIRSDCKIIADKFGNPESDHLILMSDLESLLTLYCKTREINYESDNGWSDVLSLLLVLNLNKAHLYNTFYAITTKYIPRGCVADGRPFDLFRLLLLYHDPELCSFLDTRRIMPHMYAKKWFSSLYASTCDLQVVLPMWDLYLQQADPFLVFFMALVVLVNAKEQVMGMKDDSSRKIAHLIASLPGQLSQSDIDDFCLLAQHYSAKTPQSFRRDYHGPLFGSNLASAFENISVHSLLCLPVSVQELLQTNQMITDESVRYFVVDSRPYNQYNNGHLPGAFSLDASSYVDSPAEFFSAVSNLEIFKQKTHPNDHLCFMGSGRDEEDSYLHMIISSFLQRGVAYVSLARGGYSALHDVLRESLTTRLKSHSVKGCLVCTSPGSFNHIISPERKSRKPQSSVKIEAPTSPSLFDRVRGVASKTAGVVKDKVVDYVVNNQEKDVVIKHVTPTDRGKGGRYRNMQSAFSIAEEDSSDDNNAQGEDDSPYPPSPVHAGPPRELVKVKEWMQQPDITQHFMCHYVDDKGNTHPSYLVLSRTHLYVLRQVPDQAGYAYVQARRPLANVAKITSKKKVPELLTFKYGYEITPGAEPTIQGMDRFLVAEAGDCAKAIKIAIVNLQPSLSN